MGHLKMALTAVGRHWVGGGQEGVQREGQRKLGMAAEVHVTTAIALSAGRGNAESVSNMIGFSSAKLSSLLCSLKVYIV